MLRRGFGILAGSLALAGAAAVVTAGAHDFEPVAPRRFVATGQLVAPVGRLAAFFGRPVDAAAAGDELAVLKVDRGLVFLDLAAMQVRQSLDDPDAKSAPAGLAVRGSDGTVFTSTPRGVRRARRRPAGVWEWSDEIELPAPAVGGLPAPTGLALDPAGAELLVLSGRGNTLHRLDAETGAPLAAPIAVGVAPFAVAWHSAAKAYVSNWGGDPPEPGAPAALSSGTPVRVDPRTGAAAQGSVSVVDLAAGRTARTIATGLHPSALALSPDRRFLYVACSASDEVDAIDTAADEVTERIPIRPAPALPFGSSPVALALSPDGTRLYVAAGTNNEVAVIALGARARSGPAPAGPSTVAERLPTGWYPGALVVLPAGAAAPAGFTHRLLVANTKGEGRIVHSDIAHYRQEGSAQLVLLPHSPALAASFTAESVANGHLSAALAGLQPPRAVPPRAVPERYGEPSLIEHVIYIVKENRSYDQVFGDMPQGDGDPSLVMFGRDVTPNQHALAEEFVLLDGFHCSGTLSADGHYWAMQGFVTDYLERQFGSWARSYPFEGDDPLAYSPSGFLWDAALAKGLSFRDYGEMVHARIEPADATWRDLYADWKNGTQNVKVTAVPGVPTLTGRICPTFPGFPGTVPDVWRAREFLAELDEFEAQGTLPALTVMLLPNDHTAALQPGMPSPRAMVADNDLALGTIVDAVSHGRFWAKTAIFVVEDDAQNGLDHVDGHRSIAQVISPYTRRGTVDHGFTTQVGMVKTIGLILGLPPLTQLDLASPAMRSCFRDEPDLRPFDARPARVPLDEMNPPAASLTGMRRRMTLLSGTLPLDEVDQADPETLDRILWFATRGETPYPLLRAAAPRER